VYIPFGEHILPYLDVFNIQHNHQKVGTERLKAQLMYFIVTGQVVGFFTEMVVPRIKAIVQPKVMAFFKKSTDKRRSSGSSVGEPNSKELDHLRSMTEAEGSFMKKVYKEVDMEEYDIYTDYVEMVIQVRKEKLTRWKQKTKKCPSHMPLMNSLDMSAFSPQYGH
jgi:hypothetical protein